MPSHYSGEIEQLQAEIDRLREDFKFAETDAERKAITARISDIRRQIAALKREMQSGKETAKGPTRGSQRSDIDKILD